MSLAISNEYTEIVSIFFKKNAAGNYVHDDIDVSEDENYALCTSAFHGHTAIVIMLLEKDEHGNYVHAGIDVAARNNYALRFASEDGHVEVVRMLLEKGPTGNYVHAEIKVNAGISEAKDDNYSLRWASIKGCTVIVNMLLANDLSGNYIHVGITNDAIIEILSTFECAPLISFILASKVWLNRKVPRSIKNKDVILKSIRDGEDEALIIVNTYNLILDKLNGISMLARGVCNFLYDQQLYREIVKFCKAALAIETRSRQVLAVNAGAGGSSTMGREIIFSRGFVESEDEDIDFTRKKVKHSRPWLCCAKVK